MWKTFLRESCIGKNSVGLFLLEVIEEREWRIHSVQILAGRALAAVSSGALNFNVHTHEAPGELVKMQIRIHLGWCGA